MVLLKKAWLTRIMISLSGTGARAAFRRIGMLQRSVTGIGPGRPLVLLATMVLLGLLLFLRHPRGLLEANFWGEDGWIWYPDAYHHGLRSLFMPHTGYLQTFSRAIAIASQPLSLRWAPTAFAVAAFLVRLLPPLLLLSRRFDASWPSLTGRMLLSFLYICLPNSFESFSNVTNSQWHLSLVGFLLIVASPARTRAGRACDLAAIAVCCLSGPFCLMLLPIAAWAWIRAPLPQARDRLFCVLLCALVQATCLLLTGVATRPVGSLGADIVSFSRILVVQVEFGLMIGLRNTLTLFRTGLFQSAPFVVALAAIGIAVCAAAFWKGGTLFRQFALFGALVFAASLVSPVVQLHQPAWILLSTPEAGQRYFLIPMLVLAAACVALAGNRQVILGTAGSFLCLVTTAGIVGDWSYPEMQPTAFNEQALQFEKAPSGARMAFPIHPPGAYPMELVKH